MTDQDPQPSQQYLLARAIPKKFIEKKPGSGADYVPHFVVEQVIIASVGAFDWEVVKTIRGYVPEWTSRDGNKSFGPFQDAIVGVIVRMTLTIDGRRVVIEEVGSTDAGAYEFNDAERLKKAMSDGLKRCAMRVGVGLHLWCKTNEQFFLPRFLRDAEAAKEHEDESAVVGVEVDDEVGHDPA